MNDLISRKALMKEFSAFVRASNNSDFAPAPTWNDAVSLVGSMPSAQPQRWIPCSERLPEEDLWTGGGKQFSNSVLMTVYNKSGKGTVVDYGHTIDGEWYSETEDEYIESIADWKVIAWMPLPEPYDGGYE